MILKIPLSNVNSTWIQQTVIDGVEYILSFRWNQRESQWYFSILDANSVALMSLRKLVVGIDLLRGETNPDLPQGMLQASDLTGDLNDPGLRDLDQRVLLAYVDEDSIAA